MTTAERRRTTASRAQLVASWRRGFEQATHIGLTPDPIWDMEGGDSDAQIERRLFALKAWIDRVEETDWPALWNLARINGVDALTLTPEEEMDARIAELRAALAGAGIGVSVPAVGGA